MSSPSELGQTTLGGLEVRKRDVQRTANRPQCLPERKAQHVFIGVVFGLQPLVLQLALQRLGDIGVLLGSDAASTSAKTKRTVRAPARFDRAPARFDRAL